ncbi:hypothetical protein CCAX7_21390 [Capsulimonas corticalis]|uniref:Zinc finger CGNR domain-containing protein n=1 Tax=Capsulimonas corticalis TaxID=2219043 RepID=A0A9N7L0W1_9BACT|nr:CGNR zinc finger domain-containing protein [Capsulimonas corticalis]BDI30088.1 hypothetical protein CCAX7_21390 [Capsulimonas corticalis]
MDTPALFAGGRLCLDFINTACMRRGVEIEFISDGEELMRWLRMAEEVTGTQLCDQREYREGMLSQAIELRGALHDLVHSAIEQRPPSAESLQTVNGILRAAPAYSQIGYERQGFQESHGNSRPEDQWRMAIAADAVDLLCHSDLSLLRQCECPSCVRVFYDTTKNHKRRWCVEKCGSAPKAAAYYRRKVAKAAEAHSKIVEPAAGDALNAGDLRLQ